MQNEIKSSSWWSSVLLSNPVKEEDGKIYFTRVDNSINPDKQQNVSKKRWSNMRRHHYEWIKQQVTLIPHGKRMIDVGCGQSQFKDLYENLDVCGIDFYPYPDANIITDLNQHIPLQDNSVDIAILSNVLEHIYKPVDMLTEVSRVLKEDGIMILVVPFMIKIHQAPFDFHRYTQYCLERMCKDAGFGNVRVDSVGNIFDVYDIDNQLRSTLIRDKTKGVTQLVVKILLKFHSRIELLMKKILTGKIIRAADDIGCPQSYGVVAKIR